MTDNNPDYVRSVANRLAGGKCHHLSTHVVLEAVNEILRQRRHRRIGEQYDAEYGDSVTAQVKR